MHRLGDTRIGLGRAAHGPESGGGPYRVRWTYRAATAADSDTIARLHTESWKTAYREHLPPSATLDKAALRERKAHWKTVFEALGGGDLVLLAEAGGDLLGFAAAWGRSSEGCDALLEGVYSHPAHRSMGVGTGLLGAVARRLIESGRKSLCIRLLEGDERGRRFYLRLGGTKAGRGEALISGESVPQMMIAWRDLEALAELCEERQRRL